MKFGTPVCFRMRGMTEEYICQIILRVLRFFGGREMKEYEQPKMEVIDINANDVITTSGCDIELPEQ